MGCVQSAEDPEAKKQNEIIEDQLRRDEQKSRNEVKMLLLGVCLSTGCIPTSHFTFLVPTWF
jgi:hypothetical protein